MAEDKPILNPVLALRREARREGITGGGKQEKHIRGNLQSQKAKLTADLRTILAKKDSLIVFSGSVRLVARMFEDSLATSFTPMSLLSAPVGCKLVVPVTDGYVFEIPVSRIPKLIASIDAPTSIPAKVDISRIRTIEPYGEQDVLRERTVDSLWDSAQPYDDGRLFIAWLSPLRDAEARADLMQQVEQLARNRTLFPTYPNVRLIENDETGRQAYVVSRDADQNSVSSALRRYRNTGHGAASIRLTTKPQLARIVASGLVHRIDPVKPLRVTAAGEGREPGPPPPEVSHKPIVGVIDGGLTAGSYLPAEAWRAPPFVPNGSADFAHGNKVTSVVVQGHAWNNNLHLPKLHCRIGTAQAIAREDSGFVRNVEELVSYIDSIVTAHPETRVWNLSFNETEAVDPNAVSYLGHALSRISRARNVLMVISGGNTNIDERIQPPADCEAGLVIGGRAYSEDGAPGDACPACSRGLGPEGMLKPDLSWYSPLRVLGGAEKRGSSFPTGLSSALSAHAFENIRNPSPDLVKALLINTAENEEHNANLGWGTPYRGFEPWFCQPGTVTLLWTSQLRTKLRYYWEGIPIPQELIKDGKLFGTASLTAILKPLTREEGDANYFITRVQVSLQYQQNGKWQSLLGSMKEDIEAEQTARTDLAKWNPVRGHRKEFTKRGGRQFDEGSSMRVFARVFSRDLYQMDLAPDADLGEHDVAFALTFNNGKDDNGLYNAMRTQLGTFVESAVVESDIEIEIERDV